MSTPLLFSLDHADLCQGIRPLVTDITWQAREREHGEVVGPNGAGKSALLAGLAGELVVNKGRLRHHFLEADARCRDSIFGGLPRGTIELVSSDRAAALIRPSVAFLQARWHASFDPR